MNTRVKVAAAAFAGLGLVTLSSASASARIVCNQDGDCWHVHEDYAFPPGGHIEVHPDNWSWREGEHFVWKEHPGRGYWGGGEWHNF